MSGIPEATAIVLTEEERVELEGLARSTKTQYRLRQRARIVLLGAEGLATRAIARTVGCTIGTASKWRVRFAERRRAGLDERGELRRNTRPRPVSASSPRSRARRPPASRAGPRR